MKEIKECRACKSVELVEFLDLGEQYLADFRDDKQRPPKYPLVAVICDDCKLVQLKHTTPQHEMYHDRYGFKSSVSDSIKADLRDVVAHALKYNHAPNRWLDIASNDGYLLSQAKYVQEYGEMRKVYTVGVDPVGFLCKEAERHASKIVNDYFSADVVEGKFDVITSVSCFYDMPDPSKFVEDVKSVLEGKGVWVIQQNYFLSTLQLSAVDNICHEHLGYYTLLSLENILKRFGLEVNEVLVSDVNGGSIRTIVSREGTRPVHPSVEKQRQIEKEYGLDTLEPYIKFATDVRKQLDGLYKVVSELKAKGKKIYILAASTRGATIWQSAGIDNKLVDCAVERNPVKVNKWFSALDMPIISEEQAHQEKPDYMIIGPWFFASEIIGREAQYLLDGGHLVVPLPEVKVI